MTGRLDTVIESTGDQPTPVLCPKRSELGIGVFACTVERCDLQVTNDGTDVSPEGNCAIAEALLPSTTGEYRRLSDIIARFPAGSR